MSLGLKLETRGILLSYAIVYYLRLNTGIDPTSHWTREQWTLLAVRNTAGTSVIDRLLPVVEIHLRTKLEMYLQIEIKERR